MSCNAGMESSTSFANFQQSLKEASGIEASCQEILIGFPPKLLQVNRQREFPGICLPLLCYYLRISLMTTNDDL